MEILRILSSMTIEYDSNLKTTIDMSALLYWPRTIDQISRKTNHFLNGLD
jgi:hypothetical protein